MNVKLPNLNSYRVSPYLPQMLGTSVQFMTPNFLASQLLASSSLQVSNLCHTRPFSMVQANPITGLILKPLLEMKEAHF
jgi:hypothetical protein